MPDDQQYEELKRKIAELTGRIYRLEEIAGLHKTAAPKTEVEAVRAPAPRSEDELESRIGGHWLNRVGIVAVLIGVAYFLKYAFDNGWIGPTGRVAIGMLAGIGITVWSESFRKKNYALFS